MSGRFQGKIVVVTGASSGVGEQAARQFAAEGARVVLAARTASALEAVAKDIGQQATAVPVDVSDPEACRELLRRAAAPGDRIDVLVNNAAVNHRGAVEKNEPEALAQIVDVNLKGPIVLTRLALPYLRRSRKGAVVNVASIAGQVPLPEEATYSATKFGLRAFTAALAEELSGSDITVSVVSPGPIDTGFIREDIDNVPDIVFSQPMCSAEEVANAILDSAHDGTAERTLPRTSGLLATAGYLAPQLLSVLRPGLAEQGRRAKQKFRDREHS